MMRSLVLAVVLILMRRDCDVVLHYICYSLYIVLNSDCTVMVLTTNLVFLLYFESDSLHYFTLIFEMFFFHLLD